MNKLICIVFIKVSLLCTSFAQIQIGTTFKGTFPNQKFGTAIDISNLGNRIIIASADSLRTVVVYELVNDDWIQLGEIFESRGIEGWDYVSISGDGLTIAMNWWDGMADKGQVRIFEWTNDTWISKGNIINAPNSGTRFSTSLSLNEDGNVIVIGDEKNNDIANCGGEVKIFQYNSGNWVQLGSDLNANESALFGEIVDISSSGYRIFVQSRLESLYKLYEFDGQEWQILDVPIDYALASVSHLIFNSIDGDCSHLILTGGTSDSSCIVSMAYEENEWIVSDRFCTYGDFFSNSSKSYQEISISKNGKVVAATFGTSSDYERIDIFKVQEGKLVQSDISIETSKRLGWNLRLSDLGDKLMISGRLEDEDFGAVRIYQLDIETSIENLNNISDDFIIFPNPTTGVVNIEMKNIGSYSLDIYDYTGKIALQIDNMENNQMDISNLERGIYYVELWNSNERIISKVLKL